jgi:hypothetical protein
MKALISLVLVGICNVHALRYSLIDVYNGINFLDKFTFFSGGDQNLNHGEVLLVAREADVRSYHSNRLYSWMDKTYARSKRLVSSNSSSFRISPGTEIIGGKRASVKLEGTSTYDAPALFVFDLVHMPAADCGVWPALWTLGRNSDGRVNWPFDGEIGLLSFILL